MKEGVLSQVKEALLHVQPSLLEQIGGHIFDPRGYEHRETDPEYDLALIIHEDGFFAVLHT
jgi:hypothetical protein